MDKKLKILYTVFKNLLIWISLLTNNSLIFDFDRVNAYRKYLEESCEYRVIR